MNNIAEKEINGIVYRAEFKGIAYAIDIEELSKHGTEKTAQKLFDEVLVSPKVNIDDFDSLSDFLAVYDFLLDVAQGDINPKSKSYLKQRARDNWACWRLIMANRGFDFKTVFGKDYMNLQDVSEANYALDMQLEAEKKAAKSK